MCSYIGAGTALLQVYGAEREYAWNVDFQDRKYALAERSVAAKTKAAGKAAASKMLQAKFEAEKEKEKASEKMLELNIKNMEEQAQIEAASVARNVKGFSVDNAKRLLTSKNLKQMVNIKGDLNDLRVYLAQQISTTQDEYDANIDALGFALEEAQLEKEESVGDYNMVMVGHLLSLASGYVTDKQLGDHWEKSEYGKKIKSWFRGSTTPQMDAMAKSKSLKSTASRTSLRLQLDRGWRNRPVTSMRRQPKFRPLYNNYWLRKN